MMNLKFHLMKCVSKISLKGTYRLLLFLLSCSLILYIALAHFDGRYVSEVHCDCPNETEQSINKTVLSNNSLLGPHKANCTTVETKQSAPKAKGINITKGASDHHSPKHNTTEESRTKPKFYPVNGTGKTVDIKNKYNFELFNSFCNVTWAMTAVLPVFSAPGYFKKRQAIRETVGRECICFKCRIFFVVGISLNDNLNKEVEQEYHREKDILIDNRIDTYRDCNNKVVTMLDWLIKYCPAPKYVIHFIDDAFPNLRTIIDQLDGINRNRYMLGFTRPVNTPYRDPKNNWYTSHAEWPYPKFPAYISGPTYSYLNKDNKLLRKYVHSAKYVWHEDVWFTGLVAKEANFTLIPLKKIYINSIPAITEHNWNSYSLIHHVTPEKYYWIYANTVRRGNSTC